MAYTRSINIRKDFRIPQSCNESCRFVVVVQHIIGQVIYLGPLGIVVRASFPTSLFDHFSRLFVIVYTPGYRKIQCDVSFDWKRGLANT
ncbi:uncharacterized protein Bfra_008380 [Botrytis fragariae]|uniref:Uncharacterized protein n=1 Tax=Botrytis fragariae TaxID=1964551 RepID=A0A8H6AT46_9HELO|nr:uncharacterized protein Bfra_008380 [Botrytis fragariae]KAF5873103.1 hypothetical protein Bfra_008380 [Botrytis fragariae]